MADVNPNISLTTLNINGLYIPNKRQRLTRQIEKHDPTPQKLTSKIMLETG